MFPLLLFLGTTFALTIQHPPPDHITSRVSPLHALRGTSSQLSSSTSYQNITSADDFSTRYAVQCAWDGTPLWLLLDTGSSDTWAVGEDFECRGPKGGVAEPSVCGFGDDRAGGFSTDEGGMHMKLEYKSKEAVSGPMGLADLTCGGAVVAEQRLGLANRTRWTGDNVTAGVLGLAYPALTSAYYGSMGDEAGWNAAPYPPFLTNAIAQGAIDPATFSVALERNSSGGVLAWGGLPPVKTRGDVAVADLIVANLNGQGKTAWQYSFYTIVPDGFKWDQTTDLTRYPYIIDTGTTMMYLPPPLADAIAEAFDPPAVYLYQWGSYFTPCDAIAPLLSVVIGGVELKLKAQDMLYKGMRDPLSGYCAVAIASGGDGPYILGAAFLQSVVAVFDVGGAQMRFYGRG